MADKEIKAENIPMSEIFVDEEFNCRGKIAPIDVVELAQSIQRQGLLMPVILMKLDFKKQAETGKKYKLLAGFRRQMAFIVNKSPTIPAIIHGHINDIDARLLNLTENLDRKDLNLLQEAKAIKPLLGLGLSNEEVGKRLGKSRGWADMRIRLLNLPEDIQQEAAAGILNQTHINDLSGMANDEERYAAVRAIKEAKARGEKKVVKPVSEPVTKKRRRDNVEMFKIITLLLQTFGVTTLGSRCLAWASAEISDQELYEDIQAEAKKTGINFKIPTVAVSQL